MNEKKIKHNARTFNNMQAVEANKNRNASKHTKKTNNNKKQLDYEIINWTRNVCDVCVNI